MGWKIGWNRKKGVTVDALYWNRNEEEIIIYYNQTKNLTDRHRMVTIRKGRKR